jgi:hypothetical protein
MALAEPRERSGPQDSRRWEPLVDPSRCIAAARRDIALETVSEYNIGLKLFFLDCRPN